MKKLGVLLGALCLVFGLVGIGGYLYFKGTPSYALKQAVDSFKDKNKAKFENYVDIDNVLDTMVDDVLNSSLQQATGESKGGFEALGAAFGMKMIEAFKPQIKGVVKSKLLSTFDEKRVTAKGEPESADVKKAKNVKGVDNLLAAFESSDMEFRGLGDTKTSGNTSIVPVNLHHKLFDKNISLEIKLAKAEGTWRVSEIRKVGQALMDLQKWETAYLNESNKPIREEMAKSLVVSLVPEI